MPDERKEEIVRKCWVKARLEIPNVKGLRWLHPSSFIASTLGPVAFPEYSLLWAYIH